MAAKNLPLIRASRCIGWDSRRVSVPRALSSFIALNPSDSPSSGPNMPRKNMNVMVLSPRLVVNSLRKTKSVGAWPASSRITCDAL